MQDKRGILAGPFPNSENDIAGSLHPGAVFACVVQVHPALFRGADPAADFGHLFREKTAFPYRGCVCFFRSYCDGYAADLSLAVCGWAYELEMEDIGGLA